MKSDTKPTTQSWREFNNYPQFTDGEDTLIGLTESTFEELLEQVEAQTESRVRKEYLGITEQIRKDYPIKSADHFEEGTKERKLCQKYDEAWDSALDTVDDYMENITTQEESNV